ncbi:class I SAM-dependent methyltransferase [Zavarzinia sp.]|uniref:class I SAM-dependent methyltransferase n=1 Tax=Zavarzinia sp. TaxID=2027920 RepID=UPI003BB6225A
MNSSWSREQVETLLRSEPFGYQRIELPFGLATPGDDRRVTADRIFPADMTGKSVLDLGCNSGYFCFEALRRGATRVVGVDHSETAIRGARKLADCLGVTADFQVRDWNTAPLAGSFDYVLCLNVLHHLDNPMLVLDQLIAATKGSLVMEMAGLGFHTVRRRLSILPLFTVLFSRCPVIYVGREKKPAAGRERPKVKYYITEAAMKNLLMRRLGDFSRVEHGKSQFKGRYLVIGHRA